MRRLKINHNFDVFTRGQYFFGTFRYTGNIFADFLLGIPSLTFSTLGDLRHKSHLSGMHYYIQDDWKVTPRLTLNFGVRCEWNGRPVDSQDRWATFVPDRANPRFIISDNADPARFISGVQALLGGVPIVRARESGLDIDFRTLIKEDRNNWGPRFGFAWTPVASGKTVIRGGAGVYFEPTTLNAFLLGVITPPFGITGAAFNIGGMGV